MLRTLLRGIALLLGIIALAACEEAVTTDAEPSRTDIAGRWVAEEYFVGGHETRNEDLAFKSTIILTIVLDPSDPSRGRIDTSYDPPVNGVSRHREQIYSLAKTNFKLTLTDVESAPGHDRSDLIGQKSSVRHYALIDRDTLHMDVNWGLWIGDEKGHIGRTAGMSNTIKARRLKDVTPPAARKAGSRYLKVTCQHPGCGYQVRLTRKWLAPFGNDHGHRPDPPSRRPTEADSVLTYAMVNPSGHCVPCRLRDAVQRQEPKRTPRIEPRGC